MPKHAKFPEHLNLQQFKAIQGRWFWYQSKAHMWWTDGCTDGRAMPYSALQHICCRMLKTNPWAIGQLQFTCKMLIVCMCLSVKNTMYN